MVNSCSISRIARLTGVVSFALATVSVADPAKVVFLNGRSILITSLTLQADKLVVKTAEEGFNEGQSFPLELTSHIYGEKPVEVSQAVALLLSDKPKEAVQLLEPIVAGHRLTAKIPGNFWLEAARALLVAYAVSGDSKGCAEIGKEVSDATPAQGIDPFVPLGKALLLPPTTPIEDREIALRDSTTDNLPAEVCAYASFYRGNLFKAAKRESEALEAYLSVPCLYPSGGLILNAAAEIQAADLLNGMKRREEALALVNSSLLVSTGTVVADEGNKRLESLK